MADNGGEEAAGQTRPSRLRDYLDPPPAGPEASPTTPEPSSAASGLPPMTPEPPPTMPDSPPATPQPPSPATAFSAMPAQPPGAAPILPEVPGPAPTPPETSELPLPPPENTPEPSEATRCRREFAAVLGEFRRTPVLLPLVEDDAPLVADLGGIRWIYAFSNEEALARFVIARGEGGREWPYRRVLGARLLDVGTVVAGVPCGVALDVGSEGEGMLFPPVEGIVPDEAAVGGEGRA